MSDVSEHDTDSDNETSKCPEGAKEDRLQSENSVSVVDELKQQAAVSSTSNNKPEWQQYLEQDQSTGAYTYTDPSDGSVYEWDESKRGWMPKIDDDFIAHYQANYGFTATGEHDPNVNLLDDDDGNDDENETVKKDEELETVAKESNKRKANVQQWFDADKNTNNNVYVSGLPGTITEEDFIAFMSKCGIIMEDDKGNKKIKLYRNSDGGFKGDGRCCYLKHESVDMACDLLDEYNYDGSTVHIEQAVFQLKGEFNPSLKPKKKKKKKKGGKGQDKLLDWVDRPKKRSKYDRIVILKNLFDYKQFEDDPTLINELKSDMRSEGERFGDIKKVMVFDRNPEGVASILFVEPESADKCVEVMNGRYYAKRKISAETYDGKTNYEVQETDEELKKRLQEWERFIGDDGDT